VNWGFHYFYRRWIDFAARKAVLYIAIVAVIFLAISLLIHLPYTAVIDLDATEDIQRYRTPLFDFIAEWITYLGNTLTLMGVGIAAAVVMYVRKRRLGALMVVIALSGVPINYAIKELIGRPRPDGSLVSVLLPTVGLSYPSGHAMASTMLYGLLGVLCWIHLKRPVLRQLLTAFFFLLPIVISLSRVYVGAHWLSDVVGGCTAGLFFLLILVEIYAHYNKVNKPSVADDTTTPKASVSGVPNSVPRV
jgi:undecaprenyl-diphosphatase